MVHKRSRVGHLRRLVKDLITMNAHFDRERWEGVSTLDRKDLFRILSSRGYKMIPMAAVPQVERGEILYDSRGHGSLQRGEG